MPLSNSAGGASGGVKLTPRNPHVVGAAISHMRVDLGGWLASIFFSDNVLHNPVAALFSVGAVVVLAVFMCSSLSAVGDLLMVPVAFFAPIPSVLLEFAGNSTYSVLLAAIAFFCVLVVVGWLLLGRAGLVFCFNCYVRPLLRRNKHRGVDSADHQKRLQDFYEGQAGVYDTTRNRLLRGRSTMLQLVAAQLRLQYPFLNTNSAASAMSSSHKARLVWIDIGSGTGSNVEDMHEYLPIDYFSKVYAVDITPALCDIARARFKRLGWTNVEVMCCDAEKFEIPMADLANGPMEIALVTMSYSLSMFEGPFRIVDHVASLLSPNGVMGVVDFYVSGKRGKDPTRQHSWPKRWFWSILFDTDNVYLHHSRRDYLEHKFAPIKCLSAQNEFLWPIVYIPYYIFLGCIQKPRSASSSMIDNCDTSSGLLPLEVDSHIASPTIVNTLDGRHLPGLGAMRWRQPFDAGLISRFGSYIYAFVWEDAAVDLQHMGLTSADRMLVLTSGGCNALDYLAAVGPARIHCVDLNPCQNHMLELKMAGITALEHGDFWKLFGEGFIDHFPSVLNNILSPHLSIHAYHFWQENATFSNLYKTGGSGIMIRIYHFLLKMRRVWPTMERLCHATTLEEQRAIFRSSVRPIMLKPWLVNMLNNEWFLWNTMGIHPAQRQMLLEEGSFYDYILNTINPIFEETLIRHNPYYYMPHMFRYPAKDCCPLYLSEKGFADLKAQPARLDAVRIHTDTILNVLQTQIADGELTKVVLMDHLDWFSEADADAEICVLLTKMAVGGHAYWRSAGHHPWYIALFEKHGFKVSPLQIRGGATPLIDRVNMYCSFWRAEKL